MKVLQVRLPEPILEWIAEMAKKEGVAPSTMVRVFLDREMFRDNETKKLYGKKRGNK